ncbi:hypothetical protein D3C85_1929680 [compost metagenome]
MFISAEFATANMVITAKTPTGKAGAPAWMTFRSGVSPSPSSAAGTSVMAEIATNT